MGSVDVLDRTNQGNQQPAATSQTSGPDQHKATAWHSSVQATGRTAPANAKPTSTQRGTQAAQESTTHVVRKGDTLDELSARYGVPVKDILGANPGVKNPNNISAGQMLTIPLAPAKGLLPGAYSVHAGDTLTKIAARYHSSVGDLTEANNISAPDSIHAGERIWIPGAGGQVAPGTNVAESDLAALPPVTTPQARQVNGAVLGVQSAQQALNVITRSAANGNKPASAMLRSGSLQQDLAKANDRLQTAVNAEITADVGAHASDAQVAKAGQGITSRYAEDPAAGKLVSGAVAQVRTDRQVDAIVSAAQSTQNPVKALDALNAGYAKAPANIKPAVLADPRASKIIDAAVAWANQPLTQNPSADVFAQAQTGQAIARLDDATQGLDKTLAGTVADRAAPAYQSFAGNPRNNDMPVLGPQGVTTLMNLSGRITGTPQGDNAIARFAATGAWNTDAVRNAISTGTDPAYAIAVGHLLKASGQDPSTVVQTIDDGVAASNTSKIAAGGSPEATLDIAQRMQAAGLDSSGVTATAINGVQQFKAKVDGDVKKLAQHDSELAWLVQNDGAGMTPQQLNQAVAAYRGSKGPSWEKAEAALQQQVAQDGSTLARQMIALNQSGPQLSGTSAQMDQALKTIANDPSAGLAISTAIQSDPSLATPKTANDLANLFTLSKIGDTGRKFTNELAAAYVRRNVLSKLQGLDPNDPESVAQAKAAIRSLEDEPFARMLGVTKNELSKPVAALEKAIDTMGSTPEEAQSALATFNNTLNNDASLSKAFNKGTLPGQLLRGVAVAFAGVSLYGAYQSFNANPSDPQNDITLLVDGAGFAQKNTELLVGLGAVNKTSPLGHFGGEWKLAGRASAGDLLTGISAVLTGVSAVRSGFGIGTQQSTSSAVFSGITSVGGMMAVAPSVLGAAAWLGPVGLGIAAAGVVGGAIYQDVTDAHQYEGASQAFLQAAGYDKTAAAALSKQDGVISGASGAAQMPFLAKYAQFKHLTPVQLQNWVNSLTPDQVNNLSADLLQTAGDSHGNPADFINGPPQTQIITGGSWYPAQITLANTFGVFESNLAHDHVPQP